MKKHLLTLCLLTSIVLVAQAQNPRERETEEPPKEKGFNKENLFFGGNFGLSFGSNATLVNVSPQVGYRFNRFLAAGAGVNFLYSKYEFFGYEERYGVAGLNIFGRVYPIDYVFLQIQPELNYTWGKIKYDNPRTEMDLDPKFVPSLIGGVGAAIPAGRGAFIVTVNYDLLQDERSPYSNRAFYNFGYNIGF